MSDINNGNRLDRIEAALETVVENLSKLTEAHLKHEFTTVERRAKTETEFEDYRHESEERWRRMEAHVSHLTELVRIFGDKTFEFDEKMKRVKEVL